MASLATIKCSKEARLRYLLIRRKGDETNQEITKLFADPGISPYVRVEIWSQLMQTLASDPLTTQLKAIIDAQPSKV